MSENADNLRNTEPQLEAGPARLLMTGSFQRMRGATGNLGNVDEAFYMLNFVQSLRREFLHKENRSLYPARDAMNPLAVAFVESEEGSEQYYENLFKIMREAGFTAEHRPIMEKYFASIAKQNDQWPHFASVVEPHKWQEDFERTQTHLKNAAKALDRVFPIATPMTKIPEK